METETGEKLDTELETMETQAKAGRVGKIIMGRYSLIQEVGSREQASGIGRTKKRRQ